MKLRFDLMVRFVVVLLRVTVLGSALFWIQVDSKTEAKVYHPEAAIEEIVEIYLPYRGGESYNIPRTGALYIDDYIQYGIEVSGLPEPGLATTNNASCASVPNNYCFTTDLNDTEFHDSTEETRGIPAFLYRRGAIDFAMPSETEVTSALFGTVVSVSRSCSAGNPVYVQTPDGYVIKYLHLSEIFEDIEIGHNLKPGDSIGRPGSCGFDGGGVHLHLDVFVPTALNVTAAQYEVEFRFLDRQARMINPEGIPFPSRTGLTGPTGYPKYVADYVKGGANPSRTPETGIQYGYRVKFDTDQSEYLRRHNPNPIGVSTIGVETISIAGKTAKVLHAPKDWVGEYPYVVGGDTYWYVQLDEAAPGSAGWARTATMTTCLSSTACDVSESDSLYPYVERIISDDIISGCDLNGTFRWFCPDHYLSKSQAAKILVRGVLGEKYDRSELNSQDLMRLLEQDYATPSFSDVTNKDDWAYLYVERTAEEYTELNGETIFSGELNPEIPSERIFKPNTWISRGGFVKGIVRSLNVQGVSCNDPLWDDTKFHTAIVDLRPGDTFYDEVRCYWHLLQTYNEQHSTTHQIGFSDSTFRTSQPITRIGAAKFLVIGFEFLQRMIPEPYDTTNVTIQV